MPRKVRATLLKVARDNPDVMAAPAASVDFEFGADTLNFKLYAFVDDLKKGGDTSMDLRLAILDAFSEAGITMPFRPAETAPRNMEPLREAVTASSRNGAGSGNGKAHAIPQQAAAHTAT